MSSSRSSPIGLYGLGVDPSRADTLKSFLSALHGSTEGAKVLLRLRGEFFQCYHIIHWNSLFSLAYNMPITEDH